MNECSLVQTLYDYLICLIEVEKSAHESLYFIYLFICLSLVVVFLLWYSFYHGVFIHLFIICALAPSLTVVRSFVHSLTHVDSQSQNTDSQLNRK